MTTIKLLVIVFFLSVSNSGFGQSQYEIDTDKNKRALLEAFFDRHHFISDSLIKDTNQWVNLGSSEIPHWRTQEHKSFQSRFSSEKKILFYTTNTHPSGFLSSEIIEIKENNKTIYKQQFTFHLNGILETKKFWKHNGKKLKKHGKWVYYGPSRSLKKTKTYN